MTRQLFLLTALVGTALVAACKASDSTNPAPPTLTGHVRVVHADASSGPIDVYFDQTKVLSGIAFGADTTIAPVGSAQHTLAVFAAGTTSSPLYSAAIQVSNNVRYDFIFSGGAAGGAQVIGGLSEAGGNHLASNAGLRLFDGIDTVDIGQGQLGLVNVSLTGVNNSYAFTGLSQFGSVPLNPFGGTGYADIAPDTYQIAVTDTSGKDTAATAQLVLTAGQLRTIVFSASLPPVGHPPGTVLVVPDSN